MREMQHGVCDGELNLHQSRNLSATAVAPTATYGINQQQHIRPTDFRIIRNSVKWRNGVKWRFSFAESDSPVQSELKLGAEFKLKYCTDNHPKYSDCLFSKCIIGFDFSCSHFLRLDFSCSNFLRLDSIHIKRGDIWCDQHWGHVLASDVWTCGKHSQQLWDIHGWLQVHKMFQRVQFTDKWSLFLTDCRSHKHRP